MPVVILRVLQQDVDHVSDGNGELSTGIQELCDGNDTFRLVADIDDNVGTRDFQNGALHHLAFCEPPGAVLIQ